MAEPPEERQQVTLNLTRHELLMLREVAANAAKTAISQQRWGLAIKSMNRAVGIDDLRKERFDKEGNLR